MWVLEETPWYQEIYGKGIEQGIEQGIVQGRQEGLQEGLQEGQCRMLRRLLERNFGNVPTSIMEKLRTLDASRLEDIMELALSSESLEAFEHQLEEAV
jgi:predicted transposase YdaD